MLQIGTVAQSAVVIEPGSSTVWRSLLDIDTPCIGPCGALVYPSYRPFGKNTQLLGGPIVLTVVPRL